MYFEANDITGRNLKDDEVVEATRGLLDQTEELLQFGSWVRDIRTGVVTWSSGLYSLLEYEPADIAGKITADFYADHIVEEHRQTFQEQVAHSINEKMDFSCEYAIRTKSGALKNVSTTGRVIRNKDGEVASLLCINRDITALRTFEKEKERSIRELDRSNRDLEEFAYVASHDLQEPLRKISMFTERLRAKYEQSLDREGELFIDRILASTVNMRTLIDNLLDFSRANRRSDNFSSVDLKSVFEEVTSELELKIEETQAAIHISGTLPTLEAVSSEMTQLFNNILSNAIKFRKNSVPVKIEIRSARLPKVEKQVLNLPVEQNFFKVEVQDNGIGFEPEYSERIFQIFQRLNGKSEYPGSGIGLAICKKIVEKHNGLIFAKSQPDEGCTFTVVLPEKQF